MPDIELKEASYLCVKFFNGTITNTRIRILDIFILIPTILLAIALLITAKEVINRIRNKKSPIIVAFYFLVFFETVALILRSIIVLTPAANSLKTTVIDHVFWLFMRFILVNIELIFIIFGLRAGRISDENVAARQTFILAGIFSIIYVITQGLCEFLVDNTFHQVYDYLPVVQLQHGGIWFIMISSILFFLVYSIVLLLFFTPCKTLCLLPTINRFYIYCFILVLLNSLQIIGCTFTLFNITEGLCIMSAGMLLYFISLNPLVFVTFLWHSFRSSQNHAIPMPHPTEQPPHSPNATVQLRNNKPSLWTQEMENGVVTSMLSRPSNIPTMDAAFIEGVPELLSPISSGAGSSIPPYHQRSNLNTMLEMPSMMVIDNDFNSIDYKSKSYTPSVVLI